MLRYQWKLLNFIDFIVCSISQAVLFMWWKYKCDFPCFIFTQVYDLQVAKPLQGKIMRSISYSFDISDINEPYVI